MASCSLLINYGLSVHYWNLEQCFFFPFNERTYWWTSKFPTRGWEAYTFAHMLIHFSNVWLFETLCTVTLQASPSMGFSRQEYWSGLPCPSPGDLPHQAKESMSPTSLLRWQAGSSPLVPPGEASKVDIERWHRGGRWWDGRAQEIWRENFWIEGGTSRFLRAKQS